MNEAELDRRFPRSSKYAFEWIKEGSMGSNVLWMTEWLCERLDLRPGMRVLDLGCGRAKSSIFLAREFGVEVWATDLWIAATENWQRIRDAGLENAVFPLHCRCAGPALRGRVLRRDHGARLLFVLRHRRPVFELPGAVREAGRADRHCRRGVCRGDFRRPCRSTFARVDAGFLVPAFGGVVAAALGADGDCGDRSGRRDAGRRGSCGRIGSGRPGRDNTGEIEMVEADAGRNLTYVRLVGRRREGVKLRGILLARYDAIDAAEV